MRAVALVRAVVLAKVLVKAEVKVLVKAEVKVLVKSVAEEMFPLERDSH